jgi:hypothetical protein
VWGGWGRVRVYELGFQLQPNSPFLLVTLSKEDGFPPLNLTWLCKVDGGGSFKKGP